MVGQVRPPPIEAARVAGCWRLSGRREAGHQPDSRARARRFRGGPLWGAFGPQDNWIFAGKTWLQKLASALSRSLSRHFTHLTPLFGAPRLANWRMSVCDTRTHFSKFNFQPRQASGEPLAVGG